MEALKAVSVKWKAFAAVLAVLSLIVGWYFTLRPGLFIGDDFYYQVGGGKLAHSSSRYVQLVGEDTYLLVDGGQEKTVEVTQEWNDYTFVFSDGETISGKWNGWFLEDGSEFPFEVVVTTDDSCLPISDRTYAYALIQLTEGQLETISQWYMLLVGLLFYAAGVASIWLPDEMHFLFGRWQYKNAELS